MSERERYAMLAALLPELAAKEPAQLKRLQRGMELLVRNVMHHQVPADMGPEDEAKLGEALEAMTAEYNELLGEHIFKTLSGYSVCLPTRAYLARIHLLEVGEEEAPLRAIRATVLGEISTQALRVEMDALLSSLHGERGVAVWSCFLPKVLAMLADTEGAALCLVRDSGGRELLVLVTDIGFRWVPLTGEALMVCLDAVLRIVESSSSSSYHEQVSRGFLDKTANALSSSTALAAPLLDQEAARAASVRIWKEHPGCSSLLAAFIGDRVELHLFEIDALLMANRKQSELFEESLRKQQKELETKGEKAKARAIKDLQRLQVAYDGLKARASRQDESLRDMGRQLHQLQNQTLSATPASNGNESTFHQRLARLFAD